MLIKEKNLTKTYFFLNVQLTYRIYFCASFIK